MKILETRVYRGPNLYALWPMIRLRVDLGELEDFPTDKLPGFADRLLAAIPTLAEHTCSYGEPGGFVRRMKEDEGTWLGHVLEHVAIELQVLAGTPVSLRQDAERRACRAGQYHVVYSFIEEAVGVAAGRPRPAADPPPAARRSAIDHDPSPFDFKTELERLVRLAQRAPSAPRRRALVRAAEERGIPWIRLNDALAGAARPRQIPAAHPGDA